MWQRHIDGRQPHRGSFCHGHRSGAAQHHVRGRVSQVHPIDVRHGDIRWSTTGRDVKRILLAVGVQHAHATIGQDLLRFCHRVVDGLGALRTPGDQQQRRVLIHTEELAGLLADCSAVQLQHGLLDRDADDFRIQPRALYCGQRGATELHAQLVRHPSPSICLMHEERNAQGLGSQIRGGGNVSAEANQHIRLDVLEHLLGLRDGLTQAQRQRQCVFVRLTGNGHWRNHPQVKATGRHQHALQPAWSSQRGDSCVWHQPAYCFSDRQCGLDVARRSTACNNHRQR